MMETFRSVSEELKQLSEERRNDAAAIAPSILEFETTRRQGLETKGAASLAAAGLIIAGVAVIVAGEGWIRYLAVAPICDFGGLLRPLCPHPSKAVCRDQ
jgi:hypothetical protein